MKNNKVESSTESYGNKNKNREQEQRTKKEQAWFNVFYQMHSKSQKEQKKVYTLSPTNGSKEQNLFCTKKGNK